MRPTTKILLAAALLLPTLQVPGQITEEGWAQMEFMASEVGSFSEWEKKLDSSLALELRRWQEPERFAEAAPLWKAALLQDSRGGVLVRVEGVIEEEDLIRVVMERGSRTVVEDTGALSTFLRPEDLRVVAGLPAVKKIRPYFPPPRRVPTGEIPEEARSRGEVVSEGVVAHEIDDARVQYGVDGSGVKACVLDDGLDSLVAVQTAGELPAVDVLVPAAAGGDHGTAILEILHDIAPGASLAFAQWDPSQVVTGDRLRLLRDEGCKVIAMSVSSTIPLTAFQDNPVAQAIDELAGDNVFVFVAAGNRGSEKKGTSGTWEGDFDSFMVPAGNTHDWDGTNDNTNRILTDTTSGSPSDPTRYVLEWADPLGASGNDYRLALFNSAGSGLLAFSDEPQEGDGDPVEQFLRTEDDTDNQLVVTLVDGAPRYLRMTAGLGILEHGTEGASAGVQGAQGAFTIAATDVGTAGGGAFTGFANPVENFSSDGPRRVFFTADGDPLTPGDFSSTGGVLRDKPNYVGADRVSVTTPGFSPFAGTSAAAPHIAGIAALVLDVWPGITHEELEAVLTAAALDTEDIGPDVNAGQGIIRATLALAGAEDVFEDGFESGDVSDWD
ncbi:MAG: S8 family serine peptidase [Acidobacteria bacterium]|nr:S8 family serine peptidase [Acidobacteriota bacterium]